MMIYFLGTKYIIRDMEEDLEVCMTTAYKLASRRPISGSARSIEA